MERAAQTIGRWPEWRQSALGLLLLILPVFLHALLRPSLIVNGNDLLIYYYWEHFTREQFASGHLPLWSPYILAGYPAVGNPQVMIFYPPALALRLLPLHYSFGVGYMLHMWWAGLGMYWLVRYNGIGVGGAYVGAVAFMLGGFIAPRPGAGHVDLLYTASWFPWALAIWQRTLQTGSRRTMTLSAAVIGLQFLAGHPATLALTLIALVVATVHWAIPHIRTRDLVRLLSRAGLAALAAAIVFGGFAFQLLPTIQLIRLSTHAAGLLRDCGLPTALQLRDLASLALARIPFDVFLPWERNGYFGAAGLVLALAGLAAKESPGARFKTLLIAFAFCGLLFGFNPPIPFTDQRLLPGVSSFRVPARFMLFLSFAGAGLAALGFDSLIARITGMNNGHRRDNGLKPIVRSITDRWLWLFALLLAALAIFADLVPRNDSRSLLSILAGLSAPRYAMAALALWHLNRARNTLAIGTLLLVFYSDLWLFSRAFVQPVPLAALSNPSGWIEPVNPAESRVVVLPYMFANGSMQTHTANAQGYASIIPSTYAEFNNQTPPEDRCGAVEHADIAPTDSHRLKLLSVQYIMNAHGPLDIGVPQMVSGLNAYELPDYWPRAVVVGRVIIAPTAREASILVNDPSFDPTIAVVIDTEAASPPDSMGGDTDGATARIVEYTPLRVVAETESPAAGMLVLNDVMYPGWEADVNGERAAIYRANGAFRAVPVTAGRSVVIFTFHSEALAIGWTISGATWTIVLAAVLGRAVARARR